MRRWFRRKDKDRERSPEKELALEEAEESEETAEEPGEAMEEALSPEVSVEEAPAAPEARPGFFRRIFRGQETAEETIPAPEPVALPEGEPLPPPEPTLEISPEEAAALGLETATPPEAPEAEIPETPESPEAVRKGLIRRFRERLSRTRDALAGGLDRLFAGRKEIDEALLEDLEELLITADLGWTPRSTSSRVSGSGSSAGNWGRWSA